MNVFLDCDGVLADFDTGYERLTGRRPSIKSDDVDWARVAACPGFYRGLPLMPGARRLVAGVRELGIEPTVLTGVPRSVPDAAGDKVAWVGEHFPGTRVVTCRSRDKADYAMPGDVLIDDWPKYRERWQLAGGVWITYRGHRDALAVLESRVNRSAG